MDLDEPPTTPLGGNLQILPGHKWIRGLLNGQVVVDSRHYQYVWEVPYWPWWYFPRDDVMGDLVAAADSGNTRRPPDGAVRYNLVCAGQTIESAV